MPTTTGTRTTAVITLLLGACSTTPQQVEQPEYVTPGIFLEQLTKSQPVLRSRRGVYPPGIDLTKTSEGFRPRPYDDSGMHCTIAYGHLIRTQSGSCDGTVPAEFQAGLTELAGSRLLIDDMRLAEAAIQTLSPVTLTDGQYAALCDFVYNVGSSAYERSTLRVVVNQGRTEEIPGQFRRWIMVNGRVLPGLKARREREIALFYEEIAEPRTTGREPQTFIDIRVGESTS